MLPFPAEGVVVGAGGAGSEVFVAAGEETASAVADGIVGLAGAEVFFEGEKGVAGLGGHRA